MIKSYKKALISLSKKAPIIRTKDVTARGIPRVYLSRLVEEGSLVRVSRGMYRFPNAPSGANAALADVASRVPRGIVTLISALRFHEIGTQNPSEIWIALGPSARQPAMDYPPIRFVRFSGKALTAGIKIYKIDGVKVRVYSVEKTVADCFKYRNKIGTDVAIEGLKDALAKRMLNINELWKYAKICRVAKIVRPYVEALI